MTSKNEGAGKDAGGTGDAPGQKRPHATLDLKAVEVKPSPPASAVTPVASAGAAGSPKAEPASPEAKPAGATKDADAKRPEAARPGAPAPQAHHPSRIGRFVSHLTSGVIGGATALYVLHWLPEGNALKPFSPVAEKIRLIETKLATVEEAATAIDTDPEMVKKLESTAARVDKIESESTAAIANAISKFDAESKALSEKIAKENPGLEGAAERLAKLEDRLALLSAATGTDADKGNVAQLAAITGRIADLESKLAAEAAALRKAIPDEVGARVASVAEASEAAKAGAQRNDREIQGLKTDSARLGQRLETLKADGDRLSAAVEAVREEQGRQSSAVNALKASLDGQVKALAKPEDISSAVAPVAGKIAALEKNLESVVQSEEERRADAERIVISLELANLKRALDRGQGFSAELSAVKKVAGSKIDLAALERYQSDGVPTPTDLEADYRAHINRVLDADSEPAEASFVDRIVAGAKSVVRVRRVNHSPEDTSTEAIVARAEAALKEGRLGDAIEQAKQIPPKAGALLADWLSKAEARHSVDRAIASIETELKSSLGAASNPPAEPAAAPQQKQD